MTKLLQKFYLLFNNQNELKEVEIIQGYKLVKIMNVFDNSLVHSINIVCDNGLYKNYMTIWCDPEIIKEDRILNRIMCFIYDCEEQRGTKIAEALNQ